MDSRLLNVFHEDPFEGNFAKYETEPSFWSPNDDLQLTDTLNGILPIEPTDAHSLLGHEVDGEVELQSSKNLLIYSDFVEQQLSDQEANVLNAQVYQALTDGEVEVAYEQHERHLSSVVQYNYPDSVSLGGGHIEEDVQSQCSNSTFRTRTDSSSIGDYESHSSDYDEDDDQEEEENKEQPILDSSLLKDEVNALDYSDRKGRTLSTNTIASEADALGLNIDVNNFDLADFITKDDFAENISAYRATESKNRVQETGPQTHPKLASVVPPSAPSGAVAVPAAGAGVVAAVVRKPTVASARQRESDDDDDSDSIIDVETIDVVDVDESVWSTGQLEKGEAAAAEDLCYVDNVKADPSWSPKLPAKKPMVISKEQQTKLGPMENQENPARGATIVTKPKTTNNICLVPNKKQCDFLKRKVGSAASKSNKVASKKTQEGTKSAVGSKPQPAAITGLGLGGKNLALLKHEREASASGAPVAPAKGTTPSTQAPKRKLNLEEYKQRRCGGGSTIIPKASPKAKPTPPKQPKLAHQSSSPAAALSALKPMTVSTTSNHQQKTAAIVKIVNSLKCPPIKEGTAAALPMDPITVAKNKVLRMLEMKRAQQLKIIDSRVSAKVPRVTKLPPLKDIVKDTYRVELEEESCDSTATATLTTPNKEKLRPDLDALIIVSASCNTDITIPPNQLSKASPRSLLKSSVLLYNISNGKDPNKNISNSLIASIQSEVVRQTSSTAMATLLPKSNADSIDGNRVKLSCVAEKNTPHGEDMVIMHLPKNRERKTLVSMATQTDLQPEFPLLVLPASTRQSRERSRRHYRKRRAPGSNESSSTSGSSSDCSTLASYRSRSRSRSRSHSTERLRSLDATATCGGSSIGNGGYSSRSTHRHRSSVSSSSYSEAGKYERRQRRTSYNKRRSKNQQPNRQAVYSSSGSEISDRERSRSRSPQRPLRRSRSRSQSEARFENSNNNRRGFVDRNVSQPAVEERRIVYVGRIEQETTKELLRQKFLAYGSIKQITIHYKENGMKYGFVTYERAQDAFTAIDTSPRDPQINMYDISFGGRRAFCRASYADLDNAGINNYHSYVFPKEAPAPKAQEDSFEALLLKVKAKLNAGKPETIAPATSVAAPAAPEQDHSQI
ncbi:serine/arginine repetitive matrix protein 2 [Drosophila subobscura]|uniref:serine/arginine repetitive matrix protein 2 n=1 Tax=Drosophila subobscura TaxID=7241 RepID=UPI00155AC682|nr:serine/arginine repetitive matrix protein 2 [Drosophila subobscura]XP_034661335.1 serine/arginine repetitive matrix protein 2 [Drosophila subobscura]